MFCPAETTTALESFEERVAALGSVIYTEGPEHPLARPETPDNLWHHLETDDNEVTVYTGEAHEVIQRALLRVSTDHGFKNRPQVIRMLSEAETGPEDVLADDELQPTDPDGLFWVKDEELPARHPEANKTAEVVAPPSKPYDRLFGRPLSLSGFGELQLARVAVIKHKGEGHRLVSGKEEGLGAALAAVDPLAKSEHIFRGRDARAIRRALKATADKHGSYFEAAAAHYLKTEADISKPASPSVKAKLGRLATLPGFIVR